MPSAVRSSTTYSFRPDGTSYRKSFEAILDLPKGGSIRLPIRGQLIEVKDGKVRFSTRKVTLAEVVAHLDLDLREQESTLDDLLRFVDAQRAKK